MNLLPHLTRIARVSDKASDADLLSAFVNRRDGDAFAALVRRHAGMVWSVCRRWLHDPADAEDAFQATFLVLVRRSATIDRPAKLANWLYGVAIRAARKLRDRNTRIRRLEESHSKLKRLSTDSADSQDHSHLLDEELQRLPEKYRLPVVLCHLRGLSRRCRGGKPPAWWAARKAHCQPAWLAPWSCCVPA
jgi:RNA polymerase sigma factor (sigma-70 family)